jgi:hypothetical protein
MQLANAEWDGVCCSANRSACLIRIPGVARILVRHGREILIESCPLGDFTRIGTFLADAALGAALCQRGLLVLRGSALDTLNGAALILGPAASGKSTVAAALILRGHRLIADGLLAVALDGKRATVQPGWPGIHMWRAPARALGLGLEGAMQCPGTDRLIVPVAGIDCAAPATAIIHIDPADVRGAAIEPVPGMARMRLLSVARHATSYLGDLPGSDGAAMFALANLPAFRLRPKAPANAHALAALVEAQLAA